MLMEDELKGLVDSEVAVIMNDGFAYRGKLTQCEGDVIILENIYEANNQEIEWVESKNSEDDKTKTKGYLPWRKVTLPQVIIRLPMVLRIWPWAPEQK
ncbi:MAG: hypothetical protein JSV49_01725 [Thermoplasmata archaeon]|nr:MAG: hypothetical protein JSV49_01725 [Thermoplasmata archaeon]